MDTCKKHPCPDCTFCQFCSDTRCRACRNRGCTGKRLSQAEEIALYEAINKDAGSPDEPIFYKPTPKKDAR